MSLGVAFFELPEGQIHSIGNLDSIASIHGCKTFKFDKKIGDKVNRITSSLNRYGYAIFQTKHREETFK